VQPGKVEAAQTLCLSIHAHVVEDEFALTAGLVEFDALCVCVCVCVCVFVFVCVFRALDVCMCLYFGTDRFVGSASVQMRTR